MLFEPVSISYADINNYPPCNAGGSPHLDHGQRGMPRRPVGCALLRLRRAMAATSASLDALDVILLALGLVFFALSIVYVYACDRL